MFGRMTIMTAQVAAIGALAGMHTATWGMYKDALYEGFRIGKYLRSVIVGMLAALVVAALLRFEGGPAGTFVLVFGTAYALERFALETWKSFIRVEDQSKYFIPMAFAIGGRVVRSRGWRLVAGGLYLGLVLFAGLVLLRLQPAVGRPALGGLLAAGTIGGWLSAFGGAWKDAPKEGFQVMKFFRSPAISLGFALLLATITDSYLVIAAAALGFTIATIETHKKFGRSREAPGKFAGKPLTHPVMFHRRRAFVPIFVAIWVTVAGMMVGSLVGDRGRGTRDELATGQPAPNVP
jgi:hypothetical protein